MADWFGVLMYTIAEAVVYVSLCPDKYYLSATVTVGLSEHVSEGI